MRLIRCHIENFGRLHDADIEFERGCHVICEQNGWGKSTLAAFIRVMFFGFEGENKRKNIENERKRFLPWQGGSYGGSLTFEAGESVYTVTRIFADKKQGDSFELRDDKTNLISTDFTENLGEELFLINSESFQRTVFIGQNDCVTGTTDSINARLGNITDNMNDLDSYEKASDALKDVLNRLNPRRKTGEIYRRNDRVTKLQTEVSQNASLEETIQQYEEMTGQERESLYNLRARQEEVFALQRRASRARDAQAKQAAYDQLCLDCEEKDAAYRQAEAVFPGEIPAEDDLRSYLALCDEMNRAAEGMRICRLTEEEQEQIRELRAEMERESRQTRNPYEEEMEDEADTLAKSHPLRNETDTVAKSHPLRNETDTVAKSHPLRNETDTVAKSHPLRNETDTMAKTQSLQNDTDFEAVTDSSANRGNYGQIAAGALFLIAGIVFLFLNGNSGRGFQILAAILAAVGVLLLVVGVITGQHRAREEQIRREEQFRREEARRREREETERARQAEEERRRWEEEHRRQAEEERRKWEAKRLADERAQRQKQLESLEKKNLDYQTYREQYEKKRSEMALDFQKLAFSYPDNPREQLQLIWQQRIRWQQAKRDMEAARLKKREFEAQNEKVLLTAKEAEKSLPTLEELNRQQQELEREADSVRKQLDIYGTQLDSLREKYDSWMETKELLSGEQEEVKALRQQYRQVQKAQEYLTKAKETLTARYMEPLMHSFSRYYQVIVGTSGTAADRYHMDVNTQITVEEEGMQRETAYLSRGYQDLIGLCLRLALVDAMYQTERPFLILDDPFVNLDAEKTAGGMRLLEEVSREYQVICFTAK